MLRLLVLSLLIVGGALAPAPLTAETALPREEVERIVREYLLREPEVLYQALQELQQRRQAAETSRRQAALSEHRDTVFATPGDPVAGNPDGRVTLVEFFDYKCGYCRSMMPGLRHMTEREGDLRLVLKDIPILGPDSVTASKAALAAQRQGRYVDMHWAMLQASDLSPAGVAAIGKRLGLDVEKLTADMESPEVKARIDANLQLAEALGINGTPTFVIGDELIPGAVPIDELAKRVAAERKG